MTAFTLLDAPAQHLLVGVAFFAAICELLLCLYHHLCHSAPRRRAADGALFLAALLSCAGLMTLTRDGARAALPWGVVPLGAALLIVRAAAGMRYDHRASRESLSPASVKEALDNLNTGVLFADAAGKAILVNRTMGRLADALIGSYPQMLDELESALRSPPEGCGVERISDNPALYRFPDGRIWRFRTVPLEEPALAGFTQTAAQDMTELYETNAQLERDNAALREAIRKMLEMTRRLTDMIPRQELLNMKIRIHDEIGASLIALSKLAKDGTREDTDAQLKLLNHALIPFGSARALTPGTFEEAQRRAAEMNVTLTFEGYILRDAETERLISAAALECVTNCVHHAHGSHVTVTISARSGVCVATITNDGAAPKAPVTEGGGLSALRQNVERAGGEMRISSVPRFALTLVLPERRAES